MLKKFALKLFVFFIPLLVYWCIVIAIGLWLGDLLSLSQIIELQITHNGIYRIDGSQEEIIQYKEQMAVQVEADFLVLGSSRFYFVRENIVTNPNYKFYNATVPGLPPVSALDMVRVLTANDAMPEILLINFDLAWFNAERTDMETFPDRIAAPNSFTEVQRLMNTFQDLSHDLLVTPQFVLGQLPQVRQESPYILGRDGMDSGQMDRTFNADGSIMRIITPEFARNGIEASREYLDNRLRMYEAGADIDEDALFALQEIITIARESNTLIIGVLPPYHPDFYQQLQISTDYTYFKVARENIASLFENSDMIFHDFSDPDEIGIREDMFYDGWHLGEVGTLVLYLQIVGANPAILMPYSDLNELNSLLMKAVSSYQLDDELPFLQ